MSFTSIVAQEIRAEVEGLIELVSQEGEASQTAYEIEGMLWWKILALGRMLLQLFFATQTASEEKKSSAEVDGVSYAYVGQRERQYMSLFGAVTVKRAAYWLKGHAMRFPLDEQLSLPERSYSDWVQERMGELTVIMTYEESVSIFSSWLGWELPKRSSQQINADHAGDVSVYYETKAMPDPPLNDSILVVSADGKGIPMTREHSPPPEARRGRGDKKTAKKETTVTALYTIAPYQRDADDIIRALVPHETLDPSSLSPRPTPTNKQIFGTLAGQEAAFEQLMQQVEKRDANGIHHYVALTDGNRGLKNRVQQDLPYFTLIVDIIHVTEYLWTAATILWGETHPMREVWMQDALRCVLDDQLHDLLNHLNYQLEGLSKHKQTALQKVIRYLNNNRDYMRYQSYLAQGYPIGTGVIEGACRHLVKDRFERAGMRWSLDGAQVMLNLRAVYLNDDWADFQRFRRQQAHQKRYGSLPSGGILEERIMRQAA